MNVTSSQQVDDDAFLRESKSEEEKVQGKVAWPRFD